MAHFAEIDSNNEVIRVLVVDNEEEHRGQEFLADDLGFGGYWVQTSFNNNFRKRFAGIGHTYDDVADVFNHPQPYPSWALDENYEWQPPIPKPDAGPKHALAFDWNEEAQQWVEITPP